MYKKKILFIALSIGVLGNMSIIGAPKTHKEIIDGYNGKCLNTYRVYPQGREQQLNNQKQWIAKNKKWFWLTALASSISTACFGKQILTNSKPMALALGITWLLVTTGTITIEALQRYIKNELSKRTDPLSPEAGKEYYWDSQEEYTPVDIEDEPGLASHWVKK